MPLCLLASLNAQQLVRLGNPKTQISVSSNPYAELQGDSNFNI